MTLSKNYSVTSQSTLKKVTPLHNKYRKNYSSSVTEYCYSVTSRHCEHTVTVVLWHIPASPYFTGVVDQCFAARRLRPPDPATLYTMEASTGTRRYTRNLVSFMSCRRQVWRNVSSPRNPRQHKYAAEYDRLNRCVRVGCFRLPVPRCLFCLSMPSFIALCKYI